MKNWFDHTWWPVEISIIESVVARFVISTRRTERRPRAYSKIVALFQSNISAQLLNAHTHPLEDFGAPDNGSE